MHVTNRAAGGADDALRNGSLKAQRIADRKHHIPDMQVVAIIDQHRLRRIARQFGQVELQKRNVAQRLQRQDGTFFNSCFSYPCGVGLK